MLKGFLKNEEVSQKVSVPAEAFSRTLDEIDAGAERASFTRFCYFRVMHDTQLTKRNLKPLFNVENGDKANIQEQL